MPVYRPFKWPTSRLSSQRGLAELMPGLACLLVHGGCTFSSRRAFSCNTDFSVYAQDARFATPDVDLRFAGNSTSAAQLPGNNPFTVQNLTIRWRSACARAHTAWQTIIIANFAPRLRQRSTVPATRSRTTGAAYWRFMTGNASAGFA